MPSVDDTGEGEDETGEAARDEADDEDDETETGVGRGEGLPSSDAASMNTPLPAAPATPLLLVLLSFAGRGMRATGAATAPLAETGARDGDGATTGATAM